MRKFLLLLAVATLVTSAANTWALQESGEATLQAVQAFTAGQEALQKNDLNTAIPLLEKAVSLNPDLFLSHWYLGIAYSKKQNTAKALEHLEAFIQKAEADSAQAANVAQARRIVGLTLAANEKKYAEAIPYLQKAVEANPKDAEAQFWLGLSYVATKNDEAAEAPLVKAAELDPKRAVAFFHSGRIAYDRKDYAAAKQRLDAFVAAEAEGPLANRAFFMLGKIAQDSGDNATAKTYFEKFLATNPPAGPVLDAVKQFVENQAAATPNPAP
jgi:tetratricopeptide (TPR) repeat protein